MEATVTSRASKQEILGLIDEVIGYLCDRIVAIVVLSQLLFLLRSFLSRECCT